MDVQAALRDGYSKEEVAAELGRRTGMNYQQAIKDGHSMDDVIGEMTRRTAQSKTASPERQPVLDIINPDKPLAPATGVADFLTRVVPESAGKLPGKIMQGVYEMAKGQTDPMVTRIISATNKMPSYKEGVTQGYQALGEMGRNAITSLKGLGAAMTQGLGFGMDQANNVNWSLENAKNAWATDPAGSALGLAPFVKPTARATLSSANKIAGPFRGRVTPEIQRVMDIAKEKGVQLSPADITGSRIQGLTETMLNNIPTSAGMIQKFRENQLADFTNNAINPLVKKIGAGGKTLSEVGNIAQSSATRRSKALDALISKKFKKAEALYPKQAVTNIDPTAPWRPSSFTEPGGIPTTKTQGVAREIMQEEANVLKPLKDTEALSVLSEIANTDSMGFPAVQRNLSRMKDIIRSNDKGSATGAKFQSNSTAGAFKRIVRQLENDVDSFAAQHGGEFETAWHDARNTARAGYELFDSRRVRQVMNADPGQLVNHFRNRNADALDIIKRAVGPKAFNQLRGAWVESIIKSNDREQVRPGSIGQTLRKMDEGTLKKIFRPDELREIRNIGRLGERLLGAEKVAGNPSGTGQTLLTPGYYGSVGAMVMSGNIPSAAATFFTPPAMAKMYLSKAGRKYLTEGFHIKVNTPKADAWLRRAKVMAGAQALSGGGGHHKSDK